MTPEQSFHHWLKMGNPADIQRIETSTASGIPDTNWCYNGQEVWVELKICSPKMGVLLRKEQYAWGMRRSNHDGKVFVLALSGNMLLLYRFPHIQAIPYGKYLKIVNTMPTLLPKCKEQLLKHLFNQG